MLGWFALGLSMASASGFPAESVYMRCIDAAQLPPLAQTFILPEPLNGRLEWGPKELESATQVSGPVTLNYAKLKGQWEISISVGDSPDIPRLVQLIEPDAETILGEHGTATILSTRGQYFGQHKDGIFRMTNNSDSPPLSEPDWLNMTSKGEGCSLSLEGFLGAIPKVRSADIMLFMPYNLEVVQIFYRHPDLSLPDLSVDSMTVLPQVKTSVPPVAVVQLQQSPIDLLRDDNIPEEIRITDWKYSMLHRKLRIPGAQVGVFTLNKTDPDLLTVVPITKKIKQKPVNDRRIWRWLRRLAKKTGWTLIESDDFRGQLQRGDDIIWVRAVEGELQLATQSHRLDSLSEEGHTWKISEQVKDQPLSLSVNLPKMMALALGGLSQVQVGVAIDDNIVTAQLSSTSMTGKSGMGSLFNLAAQQLPMPSVAASDDVVDETEEVPEMLLSIAMWEHQAFIKEGKYSAMDVYPYALDEAYNEPEMPSEAASNGWHPSRAIAGRYWVELTSDGRGYLIHGLAPVKDGQMRHWVRDEKGKQWQISNPEEQK